ncbi:urease accessory protein UreD [Devosia sp.]|uniref:urease accessory protein UreD n=1 Tax=Devosia sp. TaxID=1871048 RepID=UPI003BAC5020
MNAQLPQTLAHLDLSFARRGDRTVFDRRLFRWPFVLTRTFHLDTTPRHMLTVILQTSSSALLGEDRLRQRLALAEGSAVHLTTQGAATVHRAVPGQVAEEHVSLTVGAGAYLEYLPQPRILFPDAALSQSIEVDVAAGGAVILSDAFTVHDPTGAGRSFRRLQSAITVRFDADEPVVIDRLDIAAALQPKATAFASMLLLTRGPVPVDQAQALALSAALAELPDLYGAASLLPGDAGIGVRLAARDLRAVRLGLDLCSAAFRYHATRDAHTAGRQ